jgi:hypothetical protein
MVAQVMNLDRIAEMGKEKGYVVEQDVDYGAGQIDIIWNIGVHHAVPDIKCGFVATEPDSGTGSKDAEDNQLSLRKIEEAAFRGIRSGLDKVYIVTDNEEMAKSVSGKIEWLASHGSLLRLDAVAVGFSPGQVERAVIKPSQKRVPKGKKTKRATGSHGPRFNRDKSKRGRINKQKRPPHGVM